MSKVLDYDAIANDVRSKPVDYDAIANDVRGATGAPSQPERQQTAAEALVNGVVDYAKGLNRTGNPFSKENRDSAYNLIRHPMDTVSNALDAQSRLYEASKESFQNGDYMNGVRHAISYLIPVLGPAIDEAGNRAGTGHLAEGLGEATGIGVSSALTAKSFQQQPPNYAPLPPKTSGTATELYRTAIKRGVKSTEDIGDVRQMAETGVQYGIPVSEEGFTKLQGLIADVEDTVQAEVQKAGPPQVKFSPKNQLALPAGAREMPPVSPPAGTKQAILSKADIAEVPLSRGIYRFGESEIPSLEKDLGNIKYTGESRNPAEVASALENAKNAQLLESINKRAEDTGLLVAIRTQAAKAGQPVPRKLTDVFNISIENAIDPKAVASRIDQIRSKFRSVNPEADMSALDQAKAEFLRNYPGPMSYQAAQDLKQTTYANLKSKAYGEVKTASIEAQKALARGLKEELAKQIPEIADLTPEQGKLIDLQGALEKAVNKQANLQGSVFRETVAGVATRALTGSDAAAVVAGVLRHVFADPEFKSKLAIAINRAQQNNPSKWGAPNIKTAMVRANTLLDSFKDQSSAATAQ